MKTVIATIILTLMSFNVDARNGLSLNEAVNEVKAEGRVLSARTVNGKHEIKVLTPSGTVKIVNKKANLVNKKNNRQGINNQETRNFSNNKSSNSNKRSQSKRNVMKLREQNSRSRRDADFRANQQNRNKVQTVRNRNKNTTRSKNKDN